MADYIFSRNFA